MNRDLVAYHKSIAEGLEIGRNKLRNLIGGVHWQSDGEHKEAILRRAIRAHMAESFRIGRGFIAYPMHYPSTNDEGRGTLRQVDILITRSSSPVLFRDGDFVVATPDSVSAMIEVKTKRTSSQIAEDLMSLSDEKGRAVSLGSRQCMAGLFVFQNSSASDSDILSALIDSAGRNAGRAVNLVSVGPNRFFRFWSNPQQQVRGEVEESAWHAYHIEKLSQAYFVSNVVVDLDRGIPLHIQKLWFPIEGTKEAHRTWFVGLADPPSPRRFSAMV